MSSSHRRHGGCSGCGRSHSGSGVCQPFSNGVINCNRGPFLAIDADCIIPTRGAAARIPFASGTLATLTTDVAGLIATTSWIGFGSTVTGLGLVAGGNIDLGVAANEAFSVTEPGTLTAISASFTVATSIGAGTGTATVNARIYRAPAGSNIFSPTAANVNLAPVLTPATPAGTVLNGTASNFAVPVAAGDRLLMVFSMSGTTGATTAVGTASAGLSIV